MAPVWGHAFGEGAFLEVHVEAEGDVVAVEQEAAFVDVAAGFGGVVCSFVAQEADVGHEAEAFCQVEGDAGCGANLPGAGGLRVVAVFIVGPAGAEAYSAVNKEVDQAVVAAEICVARIGVELEEVRRHADAAKVVVCVTYCGTYAPVVVEGHAEFGQYG